MLNSIGVCIFFFVLREILGISQPYTIGGVAILYYYINKKYLLKDTSLKKSEQKKENKIIPKEKPKSTKKIEKMEYLKKDIKLNFYDENIVFVLRGYGNYYYTYDEVQQVTQGKAYTGKAYNKEQAIILGYQPFSN